MKKIKLYLITILTIVCCLTGCLVDRDESASEKKNGGETVAEIAVRSLSSNSDLESVVASIPGKILIEHAVMADGATYGRHFILPIVEGNDVTHFVFVPGEMSPDGDFCINSPPVVIDREQMSTDKDAWMFRYSSAYLEWKDAGLSLEFELGEFSELKNFETPSRIKMASGAGYECFAVYTVYYPGSTGYVEGLSADGAKRYFQEASYMMDNKVVNVNVPFINKLQYVLLPGTGDPKKLNESFLYICVDAFRFYGWHLSFTSVTMIGNGGVVIGGGGSSSGGGSTGEMDRVEMMVKVREVRKADQIMEKMLMMTAK